MTFNWFNRAPYYLSNRAPYYLSIGAQGKVVRVVQEALNRRQYCPDQEFLVVDGYYGPQTRSAVKLFQQDNGRPQNGELSFECLNVLIGTFNLELSDPKEGLPPDSDQPVANSVPASSTNNWITRLLQSTVGKLSLISIAVLLAASTVYLVEKGYGAELSIPKMIELILSPPDQAPSPESLDKIEANQRL